MAVRTLPNRVRELREKRKLSQRQLAQAAGIHHPAINRIEAGSRIPTYPTMKKIAEALHADVFEIFP